MPLDARARAAATLVVDTVADHVARGFFPAAPAPGACAHCDFRRVCGPHEELRARRKQREPLARLAALRATDYKTGRASEDARVIDGGRRLQPVLYALALEKLVPGAVVVGGRLDYCTSRGSFQERVVPLDARARGAATLVVDTVADHVARGFFPAAPAPGACAHCDFRRVCGPHEELRARRKQREPLARLAVLREAP